MTELEAKYIENNKLFNVVAIHQQGFTEKLGGQTGIRQIWRDVVPLQDDATLVPLPLVWNTDPKQLALLIANETTPQSKIFAVPYSWGAGYGFVQVARELQNLNRTVSKVWLIDPVYHSDTVLGRWRAMTNWFLPPTIRLPENVERAVMYYQTVDKPRAHRVITHDGQEIERVLVPDVGHRKIDNEQSVRSAIVSDLTTEIKNAKVLFAG